MNGTTTTANSITPLRRLLFEHGKRQEQLVESTGLKAGYISALCSGTIKSPSVSRCQTIARELGKIIGRKVTIEELWPAETVTIDTTVTTGQSNG